MSHEDEDRTTGLAAREAAQMHRPRLARYLTVWLALTALTVATWYISFLPLGRLHVAVGLGIAVVKALLVVLFFMHLWEATGTIRLAFGVSICFLLLLLSLSLADVTFRFLPATPAWNAKMGAPNRRP